MYYFTQDVMLPFIILIAAINNVLLFPSGNGTDGMLLPN